MATRAPTLKTSGSTVPDARAQTILNSIIGEHLRTGEPVGSRTVSDRLSYARGWSAATIRHVMAELEELGLLEQPHTSAGRVPTDKGYRFYVDHILAGVELDPVDAEVIDRTLKEISERPGELAGLMEKTSQVLSTVSQNVGIVVSPSLAESVLQHIEFVNLADNRVLVILVSASNIVQNKVIRVEVGLGTEDLERTARYLNSNFAGKTLSAIRNEVVELMRQEKLLYDNLLRNAVLLCHTSLEGEYSTTGEVYVDGTSNIIAQKDFADVEKMLGLFRTFEEKSRLVKILNECVARDQSVSKQVCLLIGRENLAPSMQECTLITAPYSIGGTEALGAVGVVGPMRIEYGRMMAVVNHVARAIEHVTQEGGQPSGRR